MIPVWLIQTAFTLVLKQRRSKNDVPALLTYSEFPDVKFNRKSAGEKTRRGAKMSKSKFIFLIESKANAVLRKCSIRSLY